MACCVFAAAACAAEQAALAGIVLTTDRTVDSTSSEAIARDLLKPGMNEQQKAYTLWRYFIQRNRHKEKAPAQDDGNAAELMTKTGYALCGTWAHHYAALAADAGLTATRVGLKGHWVGAVKYWGDWHAFDVDMLALYPKADGVIGSPGEIRRLKDKQGDYVLRRGPPVKSFPWYMASDSIEGTAGLYGSTSVGQPYAKRAWKWKYDLRLRPGMEISWSWYGDPDVGFVCLTHLPDVRSKQPFKKLREYLEGDFDYYTQEAGKPKWHWGYRRGGLPGNPLATWNGINGNGRLTFDLGREASQYALAMAESAENLQLAGEKLALKDPAKDGWLVLNFQLPYPYGDAWIEKPLPEKGLKIELSHDGRSWRQVYPAGGVDDGKRIRLFDLVRGKTAFRLKVTLAAGSEPLAGLRAVGAFHHNFMVLPALLKGKNTVSVRLANPEALAANPLHVTYVYDQVGAGRQVWRHERTMTFSPRQLTAKLDTGQKHWPLMREIRIRCGGPKPKDPKPAPETGEPDWSAAAWDWAYWGVNFWNDFERGDRHGWRGRLTTVNTYGGSDFALDNSLMSADGTRQLKLIRHGAFLNRDSRFRCRLYVDKVKSMRVYSRNQADNVYYEKTFTDLKQGRWQGFEFALADLADPKDASKKVQNGWFMANIYMVVEPAEGAQKKQVQLLVDDVICYDGVLKHDPFQDPGAPRKALADDPIWNASPPKSSE
ncbi:MAG: hypothetical protein AMJ81_05890 [Phycisphaerae bacterium SM23_33]|nr:MAG: hypothetical protein AMJ81_05890 [Phycisphaerae bacterium SM23_33]